MYAIFLSPYGWQVIRVEKGHAHLVAGAVDQQHAERIRDLLDRHGLVDVPWEQVPQ
jgi:hypothetical protein